MAFSQLNKISPEKYQSLNPSFTNPPNSSSSGSPDPRASIELGGWASDTIFAFKIVTAGGAFTSLKVDSMLEDTIDISITAGVDPEASTSYWTVDVGTDSRSTDWTIDFQVSSSRGTGTWKFTKGKSEDDQY